LAAFWKVTPLRGTVSSDSAAATDIFTTELLQSLREEAGQPVYQTTGPAEEELLFVGG
jgi:hypothetical protein